VPRRKNQEPKKNLRKQGRADNEIANVGNGKKRRTMGATGGIKKRMQDAKYRREREMDKKRGRREVKKGKANKCDNQWKLKKGIPG